MNQPSIPITVVMEKRAVNSRWVTHEWRAAAAELVSSEEKTPETIGGSEFPRHPGFEISLFRDEAEGYYLNVATGAPKVFVMWRQEEGEDAPTPHSVTASYNEAARWMDAQEKVDAVPMPESMAQWLNEYVTANYKPEPKKKRVKVSFLAPRDKEKL
jgi:Protein of unknown function (DUF3305)